MEITGWLLAGFALGLVIAMITAPVGVSGAVFLLPAQISFLGVPSPAVTPTNLLFNLVSIPGSLLRYSRDASLRSPLTVTLLIGTIPGVLIGSVVRVTIVPDEGIFKIIVAGLLAPLGLWLILQQVHSARPRSTAKPRLNLQLDQRPRLIAVAFMVGIVGGIYGIGGGSLLGPILVGQGVAVAVVAPAALLSTFVTSAVGAAAYAAMGVITGDPNISPEWSIGIACGLGGLVGGFIGAHFRGLFSESVLKVTLGSLAVGTAVVYLLGA